ncbi:hypothetical protein MMC25_004201 [Agyrium rufum]|nr:hypothetical protein [Agyrium rufum]
MQTPGPSVQGRISNLQETAPSSAIDPQDHVVNPEDDATIAHNFPAFQYNASLHHLDAISTTSLAAIAPNYRTTPLGTELHIQTDLEGLRADLTGGNHAANHSGEARTHCKQLSSSSSVPVRTPSLRSTLSAHKLGHHPPGSLSPASAISSVVSSPGIGPLLDMTPLPSPLNAEGPWTRLSSTSETSPPSSVSELSPTNNENENATGLGIRTSPKKRKGYGGLGIMNASTFCASDAQIMAANVASHNRNRSVSEYVPIGMQPPKLRNVVVSGTHTAVLLPKPQSQSMNREEYLAEQRGLSPLPAVTRPPTPPASNRSTTDSSDLESPPSSPRPLKRPRPPTYEATYIRSGKKQRWTAIRQLGKGTFSNVMLATSLPVSSPLPEHSTPEPSIPENCSPYGDQVGDTPPPDLFSESKYDPKSLVAVKICEHGPAGGADEKRVETSLKREIEILKSIQHPSLVHLKAMQVDDKRAFLVLNYAPGGDLFELASTKLDLLVPSFVRRIFAELVDAVRYLHSQYIVHRDIKLENVLVNIPTSQLSTIQNWQTHPTPIITLTDLGLGRRIPPPPASPLLDTRCGSEDYAAPELLMGSEYDGRATDAWALGVLLYAIMEGRLPFDPIPGARRQSPRNHRIARCDWQWVKWADADGDWDERKGREAGLDGAREVVEGLVRRVSRRLGVEDLGSRDWVQGGIVVEGGLQIVRDRDEDENEDV